MLIIFGALELEISGLLKLVKVKNVNRWGSIIIYEGNIRYVDDASDETIILIKTGMGKDNAQKAIKLFKDNYLDSIVRAGCLKREILIVGFCGATNEKLNVGDIVLYKLIKNLELNDSLEYTCSGELSSNELLSIYSKDTNCDKVKEYKYRLFEVNGATVSEVISDSNTKRHIGRKFGVQAVDMESYWIGKFAAENNIPFYIIRSVSDSLEENIPGFLINFSGEKMLSSVLRLALIVIKSPGKIFLITRTMKNIKRAKDNLNKLMKDFITIR